MTHANRNELMHLVLDGEATAAQIRELEALLASDASARTEYDTLQRVFAELAQVPQEFPPEGLVADITTLIGRHGPARDRQQVQALGGARPVSTAGGHPGTSGRIGPIPQSEPFFRDRHMNQQSKRRALIGGGIAAAAIVVAVSMAVDFPPSNKSTVGTIVPAQRYIAPQNTTAQDVQLGAGAGSSSTSSAANGAANNAANSQANSVANGAADARVNGAVDAKANRAVDANANSAVDSKANRAVDAKVDSAVDSKVNSAVDSKVNSAVDSKVNSAVDSKVNSAVDSKV